MTAGGASPRPHLAYVEHCLPGTRAEERLALAGRLGLALEVANRDGLDRGLLRRRGLPITTVQAYGLHDDHPLAGSAERTRAADLHVRETIELAVELGAPRVLTVCGFGPARCAAPAERCLEFFGALAPFARDRGVRILIERLSRRRAGAMTERGELEALLAALDAPDVFALALDTGHLLDDGLDPGAALAGWRAPVEEIQLRGADSRAPQPHLPWRTWLAALTAAPAVVAIEHRESITVAAFEILIRELFDDAG